MEGKINLIIGFTKYDDSLIANYKDKINILIHCDCTQNFWLPDSRTIDYSFIEENEDKLEEIYSSLSDDKSRLSLLAFINQKISKDNKYLKYVYENNQYFSEDIIELGNNEVFVDCGAYQGDTAREFIRQTENNNVSYKKIISFEPDPYNYRILKGKGFNNHECINLGTSDHEDIIRFTENGSCSCFDPNGDIKVGINKIDNVIEEDVTFIKMDVEGMELASLKGAEQTIKRCKPKLAICIYHKSEDLWEIHNYLKSIVPEYRFYIRAHEPFSLELVLYAII